ncbi:MAG: hypothetical protein J7J51_00870 [Candidatus Omnitrophica bacterium]|nr:hypothetical protein [Candidatus Omnitrophota bacterium]
MMDIIAVEEIIEKISDTFKRGGIYPKNHPVPQRLNQELAQWLNSVLEEEVDLSIAQDKLIYKDKIVGEDNPLLRQFALNLHQKGIATLSLQKGITAQEIEVLFNILILKNEFVRQQDIGEFFRKKRLVHVSASALHYKNVSPTEKEPERKTTGEEHFKILELMKEPEEIKRTFSEIARKDMDIDIKAGFINQAIEEINRLLLAKSPEEKERINAALSQGVSQLSEALVSRVLDLRQRSSLEKKEDIEDYISSIATIVGDFSRGWRLEDDFSGESIYSLDESEDIILELLPYVYGQEYAGAIAYLQKKIPELLEKKAYSQCRQLLEFFIEDSKRREDAEKEMLSAALKDFKQADLALQEALLLLLKDEAGEAIDAFLIAEVENEDKELSESALAALGKRRCLSAVPKLLSLLNPEELFFKDVDWEKKIIENLGAIGDERAVPKLKRTLEKRWFFFRNKKVLREAAVDALKKIGTEKAIEALLEASA